MILSSDAANQVLRIYLCNARVARLSAICLVAALKLGVVLGTIVFVKPNQRPSVQASRIKPVSRVIWVPESGGAIGWRSRRSRRRWGHHRTSGQSDRGNRELLEASAAHLSAVGGLAALQLGGVVGMIKFILVGQWPGVLAHPHEPIRCLVVGVPESGGAIGRSRSGRSGRSRGHYRIPGGSARRSLGGRVGEAPKARAARLVEVGVGAAIQLTVVCGGIAVRIKSAVPGVPPGRVDGMPLLVWFDTADPAPWDRWGRSGRSGRRRGQDKCLLEVGGGGF